MAQQRRKQRRHGADPPVDLPGDEQRKQSQRSGVPPDEPEYPSPSRGHGKIRRFVAEQYAVAHSNQRADEKMNQQAAERRQSRVDADDGRQNVHSEHERAGDESSGETRASPPL